MRRKAVHLVAAIAESLRFVAVLFLAYDLGALLNPTVSSLIRYAAAPQLLFAAGFFFLWLDPPRYRSYRPLLAIGKAASAACFLPLAAALARDPKAAAIAFGLPFMGMALAFFIAAVDIACLSVLILLRPDAEFGAGPPAPGQAPGDIERAEGL
jgi:hypothetical protein